MGNITDQPSADIPNKGNSALATVSLILGILGFVLPCLAFFILGFQLNDYFIDKVGLDEFNLLNVYIPMALWIVGPIAILVGTLFLLKRNPDDMRETQKKTATAGVLLGVLTIPCVLVPLLLWLLLLVVSTG